MYGADSLLQGRVLDTREPLDQRGGSYEKVDSRLSNDLQKLGTLSWRVSQAEDHGSIMYFVFFFH